MTILRTLHLTENWKDQIFDIWNSVYPKNLNYKSLKDFQDYLNKLKNPSHILILDEMNIVHGWYVDFDRDNERWFVILLGLEIQNHGYGQQILKLAKTKNIQLSGWVIDHNNYLKKDGNSYTSPIQFYKRNGFEISDERLQNDLISAVKVIWKKDSINN